MPAWERPPLSKLDTELEQLELQESQRPTALGSPFFFFWLHTGSSMTRGGRASWVTHGSGGVGQVGQGEPSGASGTTGDGCAVDLGKMVKWGTWGQVEQFK